MQHVGSGRPHSRPASSRLCASALIAAALAALASCGRESVEVVPAAPPPGGSPPAAPAPSGAKAEPGKTTSTGKAFAARVPDAKGILNVAKIRDGLYRGGQPDGEAGCEWLKSLGIKTVISLRTWHNEVQSVEKHGLTCVRLSVQADLLGSEPPTREQVDEFFRIVLDPARGPVYFHCKHGKDRTGTMAALYRIEVDGWTNAEAIEEMQEFGYHDVFKDLIEFVRNYKPKGYKLNR